MQGSEDDAGGARKLALISEGAVVNGRAAAILLARWRKSAGGRSRSPASECESQEHEREH